MESAKHHLFITQFLQAIDAETIRTTMNSEDEVVLASFLTDILSVQVAVCASGTANLFIFDLSVVSNEPKELLTAKPPSNVGFTSFNRLGLCDLAFSRGQKYR